MSRMDDVQSKLHGAFRPEDRNLDIGPGADQQPLVNKRALGNCWFVDNIVITNGANEEISLLAEIEPAATAVVTEDITLVGKEESDEHAQIQLTSYAPNRLKYKYVSQSQKMALFSEVYYSPGWSAKFTGTLNGEKVIDKELNIIRANYILRGLYIPAGEGEIEFYYLPESIVKGAKISLICSAILLLMLLSIIIKPILKTKTE